MGYANPTQFEALEGAISCTSPQAFYELGMTYANGFGDAPDYVNAHKWFNIAAMRGDVDARRRRAEIALEMSATEISLAQRLAREWLAER